MNACSCLYLINDKFYNVMNGFDTTKKENNTYFVDNYPIK